MAEGTDGLTKNAKILGEYIVHVVQDVGRWLVFLTYTRVTCESRQTMVDDGVIKNDAKRPDICKFDVSIQHITLLQIN